MSDNNALRILDASANRAAEGLRVVEDYLRFVLDDRFLTEACKQLRHDFAEACSSLQFADRAAMRDTQHDVGTDFSTPAESTRTDALDVCLASLARVKQSLRSLEEYGKLVNNQFAARVESLRYRLYTLEKAVVQTADSRTRFAEVQLCVLVDGRAPAAEFDSLVGELLDAGVGMIQLRDKQLDDRELTQRARALVAQVTSRRDSEYAPLAIINDRSDIAAATGADGVHLGQEDLSVKDARRILGPRPIIGVSTHNIEQARAAVLDGANYLGAGPTFFSTTKQFDQFAGLDYLRQVAQEITLPTFAIGGINAENLPQVLQCGITRAAVSGAIATAASPSVTVRELLKKLRSAQLAEARRPNIADSSRV